MITLYVATGVLALVNLTFKGAGPLALGDRRFGARTQTAFDALPAALLAGLVVVDLLGRRWADADWTVVPGLAAVVAVRALRAPHLACIAAGVLVTAILRAVA